ncbi:MAG TPA: hypothetical protein PLK04_10775 [Bacillota bacterium]|nr:hypothetical protein [Bacillota bacterium]
MIIWFVLAAVAIVTASVWPDFLYYLQSVFLPWIRQLLPGSISDILAELVAFLDQGICSTRRTVAIAWNQFKSTVLGMETTYLRKDPNTVETVQTCIIDIGDGQGLKRLTTNELEWDQVPEAVRNTMIIENASAVRLDTMDVMKQKMKERVKGIAEFDELVDLA